jgi:hypothetical protein
MARTHRASPVHPSTTVTFSEADYLQRPSLALAEATSGQRVELLTSDGTARVVIYPGSIADIPERD